MKKKTILFFSKSPMNYVMFQPIHQRMKNDSKIAFQFTGKPEEHYHSLEEIYRPFFSSHEETLSRLFFARWTRPDIYISSDIFLACPWAKIKLHTFHGVSFKGKAFSNKILKYDRIFIIGDYMLRRFIEKKILSENDPRILKVGMPKTDRLVNGSLDKSAILRSLGLSGKRPVVIYAPTWRGASSLNTMGEAIFQKMKTLDMDFLVKLHDLSLNPKINIKDWGKRLTELEDEHIKVIRDPDIIPYLFVSDLLISDASSTANEFTLLDRPIIFMDVPGLFKKYSETIDLDTWGRKIGVVAKSAEELPGLIAHSLNHPDEMSEVRKAAARDIFYNHGFATDAAVKALYTLLNLDPQGTE